MNRNPGWKYLLLVLIVAFGAIYATPNLFQADPGVQIVGVRNATVDQKLVERVDRALQNQQIPTKGVTFRNGKIKVRLESDDDQTQAQSILKASLGNDYSVALADLTTTPQWLQSLGGAPMYLGLDLRGGVHFLLQVDMEAAEQQAASNYEQDIRRTLRENGLYNAGYKVTGLGEFKVNFRQQEVRDKAYSQLLIEYPELQLSSSEQGDYFVLTTKMTDNALAELRKSALKKNMVALRNRIDQLGVSEPVIQQQGQDRIVIQLPGVKDPSLAREILGKTATLQVHLVDEKNALSSANGRVPAGSQRFYERDKTPVLLKKRMLFSGENIIDAASGIDPEMGGAQVSITLDAKGASINSKATGDNIGNRMAVVYVETIAETKIGKDGKPVITTREIQEVISVAVIQAQLGKRFRITGVGSQKDAQDLALLLRAGSLAAPVYIVEERTVGPSMGAENIEKGFKSVVYGFLAVLLFMVVYYRLFGTIASFALCLNLVIIVAVLSLLQATLTLPGVAGMVLTVGMAVDANVLIFERIREELQAGSSPQMAIHQGYDNAFSTIIDANLTTLIAALVLFNFGTGPIQGFAITLSIGIATSMLTAIFVSRILVNLAYGRRRLDTLSI